MNICIFVINLFFISSCYCNTQEEPTGPQYSTPRASGDTNLAEPFDSDDALDSWVLSKATKDGVDSDIAKYDGKWSIAASTENALAEDSGLLLKEKAKHHAISLPLSRPYTFDGKPFIMQYEVNFQTGIECGGAYVKLLTQTDDMDLDKFHDKTPYTIMFGPDKCGEDYKLHFIFRHKNPITGEFEEKHAKKPTVDFKSYYTDKASHLYTLVINPDNSFKIYIDQTEINSGNLLTDFTPPVNPPKEIIDENDKKPEEWDERETIPDPEATKPDDWDEDAPRKITDPDAEMPDDWLEDEPQYVDDPDSMKPEDWDDEMDGEWEAPKIDNPKCSAVSGCGTWEPPMIDNPAFKGKWKPPQIANPKYQGIWKPRMISNPGFFEDNEPYKMAPIGAVGFELWSMSEDILFDNILITSEKNVADDYAEKTWKLKKAKKAANEVRVKPIKRRRKKKKGKKPKNRKQQPGMLTGLMQATEERPWLWIIVALVVLIPVALIYSFCCRSSKKHPKKTDEPTPDDPHDTENEEEKGDQAEEEVKEEDGKGDENPETKGTGDGKAALTKADLEEDDEERSTEEDESESVRRSPRKRKPRMQD